MDFFAAVDKQMNDVMRRVANVIEAQLFAGTSDPWALAWRHYGAILSRKRTRR